MTLHFFIESRSFKKKWECLKNIFYRKVKAPHLSVNFHCHICNKTTTKFSEGKSFKKKRKWHNNKSFRKQKFYKTNQKVNNSLFATAISLLKVKVPYLHPNYFLFLKNLHQKSTYLQKVKVPHLHQNFFCL